MTEVRAQLEPLSATLTPIVVGHYEVRLARTSAEVFLAQKLRYEVMYLEKNGRPDLGKIKAEADIDEWDECAHHIIVLDTRSEKTKIVGTLRLVSNLMLATEQKFYTEAAFDVSGLREHYPSMLELGRFCIDPGGRNGPILLLIWKFAMQFIANNRVDVMFGCASFPGTDIYQHREVLTYLYKNNLAPAPLMPKAIVEHVDIKEIDVDQVEFEKATKDIPTLLRGYLKLGAKTSEAAVIDPVFNTTFICIYVDAQSMMSENTKLVTAKTTPKRPE